MRTQTTTLKIILLALTLLLTLWAAQRADGRGPAPYDISGATVQTWAACGPLGRYVSHTLVATDGQAQRYNLQLETADLHVAHTGLVAVEGRALIWLPHQVGAQATVVLAGGPCGEDGPDLLDHWPIWMPLISR